MYLDKIVITFPKLFKMTFFSFNPNTIVWKIMCGNTEKRISQQRKKSPERAKNERKLKIKEYLWRQNNSILFSATKVNA